MNNHSAPKITALLPLLLFTSNAAHAMAPNDTFIAAATTGVWIIDKSGKTLFCSNLKNKSNGQPVGQCSIIGSTVPRAKNRHVILTDQDIYIIDKSTGIISLCTAVTTNSGPPKGGCRQNNVTLGSE